jgi:hypothetical protein
LAGSVENSLQQRTQQQAFNQTLTQSINTEEDKQYQIIHEHLSQLNLAEGTSTETQKVDTSHWKSEMVTVPSRSACYTVSYPPQLNAPTSCELRNSITWHFYENANKPQITAGFVLFA